MTKLNFKNRAFVAGFTFLFSLLVAGPARSFLQANRVVLVDDFDDQDWQTRLGGEEGAGEEFPGGCVPGHVTGEKAFGRAGASLALDYDVTLKGSFSYFWMKLGSGAPFNFSEIRYLSFWMKPEGVAEGVRLEFSVEFHEDTNGDGRYTLGTDTADRVLASGFVVSRGDGDWQKVVIPLGRFRKIRHWDRILELSFIFENRWRIGKGKLLVDEVLAGSIYPEELATKEITMQNRVSSFKIDNRIAAEEIKLQEKTASFALTMTLLDPYLEVIRFEASEDDGNSWRHLRSFYDHSIGGVYGSPVEENRLSSGSSRKGLLVRAAGLSLFGKEETLAGPYRIHPR